MLLFTALHAGNVCAADRGAILVYGDSLSAAYGLSEKDGWASRLQQRLRGNSLNYTVVNASISGETSSGGMSRIAAALAKAKPAITVLALGANDGLRGLPVKQMQENLAQIIRAAQAAGSQVLLVGMRLPPNYGSSYTREFEAAFASLAKTYKTPFVPFLLDGVADKPELFQPDQLHPLAIAQERLLDNVWKALAPMLKK